MAATRTVNLLDYDRPALAELFAAQGEKPFRAVQVMKWLYHRGVTEFAAMTDLSKLVRGWLEEHAVVGLLPVAADQRSRDGTRKWLFELADGNCVETVFIPEGERGTLCVSSQVGCPVDCAFCATARQGFSRNLSTAEIVAQLWQAQRALADERQGRAVTNVVLMGMGEPLLNFDAVVRATNLMKDDFAFGLSKRRVTLSTSGIVPAMDRLAAVSDVSLAVSIHAPDDALRSELVPINRKYPLHEVVAAAKRYIGAERYRVVTFEYVLLAGVNDRPEHAHALARVLRGVPAKVNLIPYNPVAGIHYARPDDAVVDAFRQVLQAHGLVTITRKTRGEDIDAACGQLVGKVQSRRRRDRVVAPPGTPA
ncbi:MAG TPA: 23S rRNA (adenine(2503)-C(2))-methyltransferase RlmN [Gammaproteobacteria bacterium]